MVPPGTSREEVFSHNLRPPEDPEVLRALLFLPLRFRSVFGTFITGKVLCSAFRLHREGKVTRTQV